jgi:hypothetical protein
LKRKKKKQRTTNRRSLGLQTSITDELLRLQRISLQVSAGIEFRVTYILLCVLKFESSAATRIKLL